MTIKDYDFFIFILKNKKSLSNLFPKGFFFIIFGNVVKNSW
jgi:hypothetical protein